MGENRPNRLPRFRAFILFGTLSYSIHILLLLIIARMLKVIACTWVSYHLVEMPRGNLLRALIARCAVFRSTMASGFDLPIESIAVSVKSRVANHPLRAGAAIISSLGQDEPT